MKKILLESGNNNKNNNPGTILSLFIFGSSEGKNKELLVNKVIC